MASEKSIFREYLEALLIAVIFATFARTWVVQAFKIPSGSMEQNLLVGDHILVNKFIYGPALTPLERWLLPERSLRRGDVVVFKYPKDPTRDFIKRCVGLPGDEIRIVDKTLFVNGREVDDGGYVYHTDPGVYPSSRFLSPAHRGRDNFGPETLPPSEYFCLGDNRDNSSDSRAWGNVPRSFVKGRALLVYWSYESPPDAQPRPDVEGKVRQLGQVARHFFSSTRWGRTFRIVR
jgi:signal peptidase I